MSLSKLVGPLIVLGTFGTIGFLFIALVIYVTRELRRENALRLQYRLNHGSTDVTGLNNGADITWSDVPVRCWGSPLP